MTKILSQTYGTHCSFCGVLILYETIHKINGKQYLYEGQEEKGMRYDFMNDYCVSCAPKEPVK